MNCPFCNQELILAKLKSKIIEAWECPKHIIYENGYTLSEFVNVIYEKQIISNVIRFDNRVVSIWKAKFLSQKPETIIWTVHPSNSSIKALTLPINTFKEPYNLESIKQKVKVYLTFS